mmetsp:Transcript_20576/g.37737  ORF Transcript_20576/g.37737 Transcript_20576/m.37737 type:complete len:89 (+) Transcript_20576:335-601(+)
MVRWQVSDKGSEAIIVLTRKERISTAIQRIPYLHITNNDERDAGNEATHPIQEEYRDAMESQTDGAPRRGGLLWGEVMKDLDSYTPHG